MTVSSPEALSPARMYAHLLLQLHDLIVRGEGDSDEADAIREKMDFAWVKMTAEERDRMNDLSHDLYTLAEGGNQVVPMTLEEREVYRRRAKEASARDNQGDVGQVLEFLRGPVPEGVPRYIVPFLQARVWDRLGFVEVALRFMQEAERQNPRFAIEVMDLLKRAGHSQQALAYARRILDSEESAPEELYLAGAALLDSVRYRRGEEEVRQVLRRLIPPLKRALKIIQEGHPTARELPGLEAGITSLLGFCHELAGDFKAALNVYDNYLAKDPNNPDVLTMRGLAKQYSNDVEGAMEDFELAIRSGSVSVWPYVLLSRYLMRRGDSRSLWQAVRVCGLGLSRKLSGPETAVALLYEGRAICYSCLGQPLDMVLTDFNSAIELDPMNERLRQNRATAEAQARKPGSISDWRFPNWEVLFSNGVRVIHSLKTDESIRKQSRDRFGLEQAVPA